MPYKDLEKRRARQNEYYIAHGKQKRAYQRAYHSAYRDKRNAYNVAYRAAHPEWQRRYNAAYYTSHREEIHAHNAVYRAAHKEDLRAYDAARYLLDPDKWRDRAHRRHARLRNQLVQKVDVQLIYKRDKGRCHICGRAVTRAFASLDHLVPISRDGPHAPWNVRLSHLRCNLSRGARGPAQLLLALEDASEV